MDDVGRPMPLAAALTASRLPDENCGSVVFVAVSSNVVSFGSRLYP